MKQITLILLYLLFVFSCASSITVQDQSYYSHIEKDTSLTQLFSNSEYRISRIRQEFEEELLNSDIQFTYAQDFIDQIHYMFQDGSFFTYHFLYESKILTEMLMEDPSNGVFDFLSIYIDKEEKVLSVEYPNSNNIKFDYENIGPIPISQLTIRRPSDESVILFQNTTYELEGNYINYTMLPYTIHYSEFYSFIMSDENILSFSNIDYFIQFNFDAFGMLINTETIDKEGNIHYRVNFEYSENGLLTKAALIDSEQKLIVTNFIEWEIGKSNFSLLLM
jgi:hypothetical protein